MERLPFVAVDHVQLAMPKGGEAEARGFFEGVLGMREIPKPEHLRARGGTWFASGAVQIHLGVEDAFRPARKAHVALRCAAFTELRAQLEAAGHAVTATEPLDGAERGYVDDPFGNRIELIAVHEEATNLR